LGCLSRARGSGEEVFLGASVLGVGPAERGADGEGEEVGESVPPVAFVAGIVERFEDGRERQRHGEALRNFPPA